MKMQICLSLCTNVISPSRAGRMSAGSRALRAMSSPDFLKQIQATAKAVNSAEDERTVQARRARFRDLGIYRSSIWQQWLQALQLDESFHRRSSGSRTPSRSTVTKHGLLAIECMEEKAALEPTLRVLYVEGDPHRCTSASL